MSKETFKVFAKNNPELISVVMNGEASWQKLYELYEIYGDDKTIWSKYIKTNNNTSIKDVFNNISNMDMDSLQKGIDNLQKAVGLLQGFTTGNTPNSYIPSSKYTHLED